MINIDNDVAHLNRSLKVRNIAAPQLQTIHETKLLHILLQTTELTVLKYLEMHHIDYQLTWNQLIG